MALLGTSVVFFTVGEMTLSFNWQNAEFASLIAVAFFVWMGFLMSGIHPTLAGVVLGLLTPARPIP